MPITGLTFDEKHFLMTHYVQSEMHRKRLGTFDPESKLRAAHVQEIVDSCVKYGRIIDITISETRMILHECGLFQ